MVYLISYDLNAKPEESYENLISAIKAYGDYCKPLKSQWFIASNDSAGDIYNSLTSCLLKNDKVYVNEIKSRGQGWLDQTVWDWFQTHGL